MQIEISFAVWKVLNALLVDENDTHEEVIKRALGHNSFVPNDIFRMDTVGSDVQPGAYFKGVHLPEGTKLRASYKGETYFAEIFKSQWIDLATKEKRSSPSQAAYSITGSGANGWLFWQVRRPNDKAWLSLNALRNERI